MQQMTFETISELRNRRIQHIKDSLRRIPIISKNSHKIEEKMKTCHQQDKCSSATKIPHDEDDSTPFGYHDIKEASLFQEKYQIGVKIGEGANGFVNLCLKAKSGITYAVKSLMMDEQHIMELKENFLAIRSLKHPNIIEYKALYIDMRKKLCYLVMQYVNLPSLQKVKIQSQDQLKLITYQILDTVRYLHEKSVCHRDIKPQNVLYDAGNKKIKIIDFGTSKKFLRRDARFQMLTITGTLFYRAPQMFSGGGYDQKVDIWSIGILVYKLICGKTPFQSSYLSQTIDKIKDNRLSFQDHVWDKTDNNLKNLIKRMLKKSKDCRLSASECLRDVWFYSLTFQKLSELTKSFQKFRHSLQRTEYDKKVDKHSSPNGQEQQALSHIIKQIDGQDYHLMDSQEQNTPISKSTCNINSYKRPKKRLSISLIL